MTILREPKSPNDPEALALAALGWVLSDEHRARRLLALTGLTPEALREGLQERGVLAAVLEFLTAHEPDLIAAAHELGIEPAELAAAARGLVQ
ncbi:MAG TPA: DUF3572 domain-containing protein [Sphingomonadaceae bacterium]|nr:DUF3572 domain-containing protein [Sphingomonadaceae bacterium]